jgi:hypothetical protein
MTDAGFFVRKIVIRRWFTDPDWIEPRASHSKLPRWLYNFFDARPEDSYRWPSWLNAGELTADCLRDLGTDTGTLSVFFVPESSAGLIAKIGAAMVAGGENLARFEYCKIDKSVLDLLGLKAQATPGSGATLDQEVNSFHHDIVELTADKAVMLAKALKQNAGKAQVSREAIKDILGQRIKSGNIPGHRVHARILKSLGFDSSPGAGGVSS